MSDRLVSLDRRTVLQSLLVSGTAGLAGCSNTGGDTDSNPITDVSVSGTALEITLREDHSVDQITIIQPDGSSFASRSVTPGSTSVTVEIGTQYSPGEYTVNAVSGEETLGERTLSISPDVQITDLKLARNHPDEMYESAGKLAIQAEAIVTVENKGSGPDSVTQLLFKGDIPQPTTKDSDKSWIYDTESKVGGEVDSLVVPPSKSTTIYSTSRPFTTASSNVSCTSEGEQGQFSAIIHLRIGSTLHEQFNIEYTGEDLSDCSISISGVNQ